MPSSTEVRSPVVEFYSRASDKNHLDRYLSGIERWNGEASLYMNNGLYLVPDQAIRQVSVDEKGIWHIRFSPEARYVGIKKENICDGEYSESVCINYPNQEQIQFDISSIRSVRRHHDGKLLWENIRLRPKDYLAQQLRARKRQ